MTKPRINLQTSIEAESLEERLRQKGYGIEAVSYYPKTGKIYLGDGREHIEKSNWLVDVDKFNQVKVLGASGKIDDANKIKNVFSNKYLQMLANKIRVDKILDKINIPYYQAGKGIVGAAGPTAVTDYQDIRRTGDLLDLIIKEMHTTEDYQAINIAKQVNRDAVKFEYIKRTTAKVKALSNLADDDTPPPLRHVYTTGTKEIFAYGVQWNVSMRDNIDTKADVTADFLEDLPGMFLQAKNDDVVTLLNAIGGNNQGDWDAFTGGIADVDASSQVQTAEDSVKKYGTPLVAIMHSVSLRAYLKNLQGAYFQGISQNDSSRSTSGPNAKTGRLPGNPNVTYFVDDNITSATYILAAVNAYMKYFQAMVIQSSVVDKTTPGQTERRFWFDFAGFEESQTSAQYKGTSVTT